MELLEGGTLREKMSGRPLPLGKAVEYARQIGLALVAAHERGIVHRDIKPENVFVTREGRIKILDFGIAQRHGCRRTRRRRQSRSPGSDRSEPRRYMSPEQARGARADHRADLFSLGVVLYEMMSGISPFRRETAPETMTAILREPAARAARPGGVSARASPHSSGTASRRIRRERFQSARDLVFNLDAHPTRHRCQRLTAAAGVRLAPSIGADARRPRWRWSGAAGFFVGQRTAGPDQQLQVSRHHRFTDFNGLEEFPAIAPDLKSVAFTARVDGFRQIFVRLLAGGHAAAGHQGCRRPRAAALVARLELAPLLLAGSARAIRRAPSGRSPRLGGAARRIIDSVGGGDIGADGRIAMLQSVRRTDRIDRPLRPTDPTFASIARFHEPAYYKYPALVTGRRSGSRTSAVMAVGGTSSRSPSIGGPPRQLTHDNARSMDWRGCRTAAASSTARVAARRCRTSRRRRCGSSISTVARPRQIAPAELSYLHPDVHASGAVVASRLQDAVRLVEVSDRRRLPTENVRRATRDHAAVRPGADADRRRQRSGTSPSSPTAAGTRISG